MNLTLFNLLRGVGASQSEGGGPSSGLLLSFDSGTTSDPDYITTSFSDLYEGGFFLSNATAGTSQLEYGGRHRICKGSVQGRMFCTGEDSGTGGTYHYGEFAIPTLSPSTNPNDWNIGSNTQAFRNLDVDFTHPHADPTIPGLYYNAATDDLFIGLANFYTSSAGQYNMCRVAGASDLSTADFYGAFQLAGGTLAGGYASEIPAEYQAGLGGTHIFGGLCGGQIISRLNNGVAAYVVDIADLAAATATTDTPASNPAMRFPHGDATMMSTTVGAWNDGISKMGNDWVNGDLDYTTDPSRSATNYTDHSDVWNHLSQLAAAFFIPGTRTFMAIGYTGGILSNIRYGDVDDTGEYRSGFFPYDHDDIRNEYWLFDVDDLLAAIDDPVTNPPHRIRPYQQGEVTGLPIITWNREITGAYYDTATNQLVLSIQRGGSARFGINRPGFIVLNFTSVLPA